MRQAGEPSVDEILASIKKVIARDSQGPTARDEAPVAARGDDVLDLGAIAAQVLGNDDAGCDADSPALLKPSTASAMRDTFDALALLSAPGAAPPMTRAGETSLEGLVREMLRPMLAEWLDAHLPATVDRLVAAEIARIARKKG